jgi:hypothetical protein
MTTEIVARVAGFDRDDDTECLTVGFAESPDGSGLALLFQVSTYEPAVNGGNANWVDVDLLGERAYSITISPTIPWSACVLPSLPTMPQRRSVTRPVATGTNHHSATWPG